MTDLLINELAVYAKNLSVLVVEDEDDLREEISSLLSCFFRVVIDCKDGKEALDRYKNDKFDIVITDIRMPRMSGVEFSREIKTLNKDQIVVVLSGYINESVVDLIDIGIDTLILKPYNLDTFLQKLIKHCENIILKKEFEKNVLERCLLSKDDSKVKIPEKNSETSLHKKSVVDEIIELKTTIDPVVNKVLTIVSPDDVDTNMWKFIKEEIEVLNHEFLETVEFLSLKGVNEDYLIELGRIFNRYYQNLSLINELNDFAKIFLDLAIIFQEELDYDNLDKISPSAFTTLEYFYEDLTNFFYVVFVSNEAQNIHYLTDSFKSSIVQLKIALKLQEELTDEDELELF